MIIALFIFFVILLFASTALFFMKYRDEVIIINKKLNKKKARHVFINIALSFAQFICLSLIAYNYGFTNDPDLLGISFSWQTLVIIIISSAIDWIVKFLAKKTAKRIINYEL